MVQLMYTRRILLGADRECLSTATTAITRRYRGTFGDGTGLGLSVGE